jgi:amino acid transporter
MFENAKTRPDLLLLLSLVLVILMYPALDHGDFRHVLLGALMFVPVILATVRLAEIKAWVWPSVLLMLVALVSAVLSNFYPNRAMIGTKWAFLAGFFALTVLGLFSYLKNAHRITTSHLYTAVSIYLLLGFQWFAIYSAIDSFYPGAIQHNNPHVTDHSSGLLYFSLVTLSTIGYGDVVPIGGEVRMLAALEGVTGVLYIAITVAILVSSYRSHDLR